VSAELGLKLALSLALAVFFCVPYFLLQAAPVFPVRTLPLTWMDRAVTFSPNWVWVYQSVYLLMAIVPWLAARRDTLLRYARGFVWLSTAAFVCFFLVPVAGPRPLEVPNSGMFAVLVWYDGPLNSFPSLHCGLAAYTVLLAAEISRDSLPSRSRQVLLGALAAWLVFICYATLATKQHYAVDVAPGLLLGWLGHGLAWRGAVLDTARTWWAPQQVKRT
jgi:membrane-associated phospholipid phosphatase